MPGWIDARRIIRTATVPILLTHVLLVACTAQSPNGGISEPRASDDPAGAVVYLVAPLGPGPLKVKAHEFAGAGSDAVLPLTFDPAGAKFGWSPDGAQIALVRDDQLLIETSDGSDRRTLRRRVFSMAEPAWSPDGSRLAVLGIVGDFGVTQRPLIVDVITGEVRSIYGMDGFWNSLDWSPDGRKIAIAGVRSDPPGTGIWVFSADGEPNAVQIAPGRSPQRPRWSPDGQRLLFFEFDTAIDDRTCADFGSVASSVWTVGVDGSEPKRLTDWEGVDGWPIWSPDGKWVAFGSDRPVDWNTASDCRTAQPREIDVWVMRADGTDPRLAVLAGESFTAGPIEWRRTT